MATGPIERHLAAIVAADVVGYSRLMGVDEKGTLSALKAHRTQLIDPLIAAYKGHHRQSDGRRPAAFFSLGGGSGFLRCGDAAWNGQAQPGHPRRRGASNSGLASISATSSSRRATCSATASTSRLGLSRLRRPAASACPRTCTGRFGASSIFPVADAGEQNLKNISSPVRVYRIEPSVAAAFDAPPLLTEPQPRGEAGRGRRRRQQPSC